jgi:diacylglycerol kinase (ATP)
MRKVHFIINPSSGQKEPILSYINDALEGQPVKWEVSITKKGSDAYTFTKQAVQNGVDVIAVYGGDGTVMEAAKALFQQKTPLLVLPGGTANILAKELFLPLTSAETLKLLTQPTLTIKTVDMGMMNGTPFVLRVNLGIFAHMIVSADRTLKRRIGQLAYSLTAIRHILRHRMFQFEITMDGKSFAERGVGLMVSNAGNIGIQGQAILPTMSITDGFLDVVLVEKASHKTLFTWLKSKASHTRPQETIKHWKAKKISVTVSPQHQGICDDSSFQARLLDIEVIPKALKVVVP